MSLFDPSKLSIGTASKADTTQEQVSEHKVAKQRQTKPLLKGPIPLDWLIKAAQLSGKTFIVGIILWYQSGLKRERTFSFSTVAINKFGLNKDAKKRALDALEKVGLITVQRSHGKNPVITILDVKEDEDTNTK